MADCIACSCVTCPKCGTWVVVTQPNELGSSREKFRANCPAPECGKEFEFEAGETRVFEIPLPFFKRRISTVQNCAEARRGTTFKIIRPLVRPSMDQQ